MQKRPFTEQLIHMTAKGKHSCLPLTLNDGYCIQKGHLLTNWYDYYGTYSCLTWTLFYHHEGKKKQECIPVGCVPPTAVAVCWECVSASVHAGIHPLVLDTLPGLGLDTPPWVWAWTPPWVWTWTPPARPLRHPSPDPQPPPSSGPKHPLQPDLPTSPLGLGLDTPPVDRILDTHFWKCHLAPTSLRAVIILFIGGRFFIQTLTVAK